jgi:hypothetical protein
MQEHACGSTRRPPHVLASFASKSGGEGVLAFAAHRHGLPSRAHFVVDEDKVDFPDCELHLKMRLFPDAQWGAWIDFGRSVEEAEETCAFLLEMIEEQAVPFVSQVPNAYAQLAAVRVDEFETVLPELVAQHNVRVVDGTTAFAQQRIELALFLARLACVDGRRDSSRSWAELGLELLSQSDWPDYPRHTFAILFERLRAGAEDLHITAADRAERDRRTG